MRALLRLAALVLLLVPGLAHAEGPVDHRAVAAQIVEQGRALVLAYDPASGLDTSDAFSDLYFNVFEETGLEADIGAADPGVKTELESYFAAIIGSAAKGAAKTTVEEHWRKLETRLPQVADQRAEAVQSGWIGAFLQSVLILLREGFEAILVIGALVAYLRRLGADDKLKVVWRAVVLALLASAATAWAMNSLIETSGADREAVEGLTMLVAAVVLTYVSHWLFARREAQRWQGYIKEQVEKALSGGQMFSLGFAAFLAVYREGAETVLFYQALMGSAPGHGAAIGAGFVVAAIGLVVIYWAIRKASMKIPLAPFFTGTAVLLYALAVMFAGQGMLELQEARWISITPLAGFPNLPSIGLFPTLESVAAQAALLATLIPVIGMWAIKRAKAAS
jgi:high-affinity iron transporter